MADRNQNTWVDEQYLAEERARAAASGTPEPTVAPPPEPEPRVEPALTVAREAAEPLPEARAPKPKAPRVKQHRVRRAVAAFRSRIAADLAAHWLAYIGVVLIFVGVFGFMVFSFRDVGRNWRPVAEVMIPVALAGAAWYLRRQHAPFVASLVAGLAGALLPIAVITSFNDDFSVPRDIMGMGRPLVTGGVCVLIGGAYAWWTTRRPETPLRFLAAPAMWLGVGVAAGAFADPIPLGTDVARADAWQSAAMMIAIAVSVAVARWKPRHPLSEATMTSAFPGIGIVSAFVLAAILPDGSWYGAGTAAALALLVTFDLLEPRLRPVATAILDTVALAGVILTLAGPVEPVWIAAIATVSLLALMEWVARRATPNWMLQTMLALVLLPIWAVMTMAGPTGRGWPVVVSFGAVALWANVRRIVPARWLTSPELTLLIAGSAPFGVAAGLLLAVSEGVALASLAAMVLAVAAFVRFDRDTDDPYWRWAVPGWAAAIEVGVVIAAFSPMAPMYAWLAGAAAVLTATAAIMPADLAWRRWITVVAFAWTGWLTAMAFDVAMTGPAVRTITLAVLTAVAAYVATRVPERYTSALALIATALGLGTFGSLGAWRAWDPSAWTVGFAVVAGMLAVVVLVSEFVIHARRDLVWPWGVGAVLAVAVAFSQVLVRPYSVGEGLPGFATAAAAVIVGGGSWLLVRRWSWTWLVDLGVAGFAVAATSFGVGFAATQAEVTIAVLAIGTAAAVWTSVVGPTPTLTPRRSASMLQRAGLEITALSATTAWVSSPDTGNLGWLAAVTGVVVAGETLAIAVRWRMPNLTFVTAWSATGALVSLGLWASWATATWLMVGSVATAAVVVVMTGVAIATRVGQAWARPWLLLGLGASGYAVVTALIDADGVTRGTTGYVVAGATLAVAVVGALADRWEQDAWRWVAALWVGLAAAVAAVAADLDTAGLARGAAVTAIAVTVLVVATWRVPALAAWHRAGTALAALALLAAVPGTLMQIDAAAQWSDVASLVTLVLFACAIESWTFGTLWKQPFLAETAPFWLVGAWCAFAAGSLNGNAQWYTVPIGVAVIGVEEIRRNDHRHAGLPPYSVSGRWIEYLGMMLIVGASMFQTVTVNPSYALIGIVLGMAIATWGALTHVRRRAIFGTCATLLAVVLMLAVPLARALPNTPGIVVWLAVAAIGVIAVTGAAFIERGRHAVRSGMHRFGTITHDWE